MHVCVGVRAIRSAFLRRRFFKREIFSINLAFVRQDGVGVIEAEATRSHVPDVGVSGCARRSAKHVIIVEGVGVIIKLVGVDVGRLFQFIEHVAAVIFFLVAFAVAVALKNVRETVRCNDAEEISRSVAVAVARAASDSCEVDANMNARISE